MNAEQCEITLIVDRRMLVDANTALAGVMLEISFARSRASMATFNVERAPSRPFCCWGVKSSSKHAVVARKWCGTQPGREKPNVEGGVGPIFMNVHANVALSCSWVTQEMDVGGSCGIQLNLIFAVCYVKTCFNAMHIGE